MLIRVFILALAGMVFSSLLWQAQAVRAQATEQQAAATEEQARAPLTEEELEVLVARIALYPNELVAVITASALYSLQIVEAARYIEDVKKSPDLKPNSTWDGSVISLLDRSAPAPRASSSPRMAALC